MERIYKNFNIDEDVLKKDKWNQQNIDSSKFGTRTNYAKSSYQYKYLNLMFFNNTLNYDNITLYNFDRNDFKELIKEGTFTINSTQYTITNNTNRDCINQNSIISTTSNSNIGILIKNYGCIIIYTNLTHDISANNMKLQYKQSSQIYWCRINHADFNLSKNITWDKDLSNTYFNTIGLYDISNNLLAVARLSQNIKKNDQIEHIFKVKVVK